MTLLHTEFSSYEIDQAQRRIRRIGGVNPPTPNQGPDGDWQSYESITRVGDGLMIVWDIGDDRIRRTWTSRIEAIEGELE